jgi:predicted membrane-bound spermidine synthase
MQKLSEDINALAYTRASWYSYLLFIIIVCEGFVSVAIEILAIRQLNPFVGTSVVVTSLIIGIFLLFLAIGYWRGGLYSKNFYVILRRNFLLAAAFVGIGMSYVFVAYFFASVYLLIPHILWILALYLLFIIAPLVYFLGQTIPLTMNLVNQEQLTGATGGKVLFWSTVGSFFGSVLTTLLLMEFFGVAWTVYINTLLLLLLFVSLLFFEGKNTQNTFIVVLLFVLVGIVYIINISFEEKYFVTTNNYANYFIEKNMSTADGRYGKMLQINASASSFVDANNKGFRYVEVIKNILFNDLKLHDKNILVLGAGGFTLSAAGTFGNNFTYVDIDPKIKNIVAKHFLPEIKGNFIAEDARTFFNHHKKIYDVIISDVYSNINTIPAELVTMEHLRNVKSYLADNGFAIFNIIANPFFDDPYSKRVNNTILTVFKNCTIIPLRYNRNFNNIIYVCHKTANENDSTVYTDDKNSVTMDFWRGK